jgi:hypothetical protein
LGSDFSRPTLISVPTHRHFGISVRLTKNIYEEIYNMRVRRREPLYSILIVTHDRRNVEA